MGLPIVQQAKNVGTNGLRLEDRELRLGLLRSAFWVYCAPHPQSQVYQASGGAPPS